MIYVNIQIDDAGLLTKRDAADAMRAGYLASAKYWIKNCLPKHFQRRNADRYGYQPRSPIYIKSRAKAAARRGIQGIDLVYSGESRARALGGSRAEATANRGRVVIPAPTLNRRPHMVREATAVRPDEIEAMTAVMQREIDAQLARAAKAK